MINPASSSQKTTIIRFSTLVLFLIQCIVLPGQIPEETPLFPEGIENNPIIYEQPESYVDSIVKPGSLSKQNRVYSYISEPSYLLYPANDSNNKHIAVVIFPGGGLRNNWVDKEGNDLAIWLAAKGINCMVLKYRTNQRDEKGKYTIPMDVYKDAVVLDARTSMLKMKKLSDSLNFDRDKVGVVGFSAGGWLIEKLIFRYYDGKYDWQPAFAGYIYFGNHHKQIKKIKNKELLPPFFMATSQDDRKLPLNRVLKYLTMIIAEVDDSELHIYAKGPHGFGLAYDDGHSVELWKESFYRWMLDINGK